MPRRSVTPVRKFSTTTSADCTSRMNSALPSADLRLSVMAFLARERFR